MPRYRHGKVRVLVQNGITLPPLPPSRVTADDDGKAVGGSSNVASRHDAKWDTAWRRLIDSGVAWTDEDWRADIKRARVNGPQSGLRMFDRFVVPFEEE